MDHGMDRGTMDRGNREARLSRWFGALAVFGLLLMSRTVSSQGLLGGALKENLDLPYNAGGSIGEDDEDAPEVVVFYGSSYEASAVVFALDESGSMRNNGRWQLQTREVVRSISELSRDSEFGVVYYGSRVSSFRNTPLPATASAKSAGIGFVQSRSAQGDTCIAEGVVEALRIVKRSSTKYQAVIVTSDGRPDVCATGDRATAQQVLMLYQMTLAANPARSVRVHSVWVGQGSDRAATEFLRRLAALHGGSFRTVSN